MLDQYSYVVLISLIDSQLADFGLAKWKSGGESFQTRILGTSG